MTDPEQPLLEQLREVFRRADRGPLIVGLVAIAVIIVIVSVGGGSDGNQSIPRSVAIGDDGPVPGSAEPSQTPTAETTEETTTSGTTEEEAGTSTAEPEDDGGGEFAVIRSVDSSWIAGQGSLVTYDGYLAVTVRAEDVASNYQAARDAIEAEQERLAELQRKQAQQAARRHALAAYRAALRAAARERKRQERLLAERRQRIKEKLQRLREKYKVDPGEECQIPEVQAAFDCSTGYPF